MLWWIMCTVTEINGRMLIVLRGMSLSEQNLKLLFYIEAPLVHHSCKTSARINYFDLSCLGQPI